MTAFDRFDPFERRISSAIDEIAAERQPHYLDDIFRLTARSKQRPRWQFPERWLTMNFTALRAAVATTVVVIVVGGILAFNRPDNGPGTSPSPSPTESGSAQSVGAAAQQLRGIWIADADALPEIDVPAGRIQLWIDWDHGDRASVHTTPYTRDYLDSQSLDAPNGELRLRTAFAGADCDTDAEGRYAWSRSNDGFFLTLTLIEDACAARATAFARTWVRSFAAASEGGHGVVDGVTPMVEVTLPAGQRLWGGAGDQWQAIMTDGGLEPYQAFVVIRNPGGFAAPCSTSDPQPTSIPATTTDLVSYIDSLPGASVVTAATEIDGRPAIQFDMRIDNEIQCESGDIFNLHPESPSDTQVWTSVPGELQRLYVVQIDASTTFLLWYQGNSETERAVIASVHFLDKLPTP